MGDINVLNERSPDINFTLRTIDGVLMLLVIQGYVLRIIRIYQLVAVFMAVYIELNLITY